MAPQYHLTELGVNSALIPGSYLACNKLGLIKRAFLAADLHLDVKHPTALTQIQAAMLARVNRTYVHYAVKRIAERAEIEAGLVPLVPAAPTHTNGNGTVQPVAPDVGIADATLVDIARVVGPDRMLAAAVAAGH
jgi:hypothetical protein